MNERLIAHVSPTPIVVGIKRIKTCFLIFNTTLKKYFHLQMVSIAFHSMYM